MPDLQAERLVVGITGASGVIYGLRALDALSELGVESHLVLSRSAALTLKQEAGLRPSDLAVGDALHLERMQAAEIGDLLEGHGSVVHQPDGRGLRHQDLFGHGKISPFRNDGARPFGRAG